MKTIAMNQSNKGTEEAFPEVSPPPPKSPIFRHLILKSLERNPVENSLLNISSGCLRKQTHVLNRDNLAFCYAKKGSTRPT